MWACSVKGRQFSTRVTLNIQCHPIKPTYLDEEVMYSAMKNLSQFLSVFDQKKKDQIFKIYNQV